ncbi:MAG: cytochrome c [Hyphomonadaceae bacterium]|nr:cytochrome c [Hyphomonadaceae bacterium]
MLRRFAFVVVAITLAACAAPQAPVDEAASLAEDGRSIAEAQCAACHAVGEYGDSPVAAAPTFRTLLSRYRADVLEEELINGIRVAHPMPEFQFNPQSADALVAYLRTVQETPAP